jgi:hypothetical protein
MILRNSANDADLKLPSEYSFRLLVSVVFASAGAYVLHKSSPPVLAAAFFVAAAMFFSIDLLMKLLMPTEGELLVDGQSTIYPPCGATSLLWNWNTNGWWCKTRANHAYSVDTQNDGSSPWRAVPLRFFIRCLYKENKK